MHNYNEPVIENPRRNKFREAVLPRACPLHQLTNFACKRMILQDGHITSSFFKKSEIFFEKNLNVFFWDTKFKIAKKF